MKISEIISHLETIAPPSLQEDYDNSGLIVGNADAEISKVLICLDSTEDVVEEAIREKCGLIIAHHPVIFRGIKRLTGSNYVERTVIKAIQNNIAIYACHTNLDNVKQGVNQKFAEKLGLKNLKILEEKKQILRKLSIFCPKAHTEKLMDALFAAGGGHIGNYSECSFRVDGTGTFKGDESTNPFVGEKGNRHQEEESKIEIIFPAYLENQIIKTLKESHPYEEVAYDLISLENANQDVGAGMVGELENEMSEKDFLAHLKSSMNLKVIRHTLFINQKVNKVALCGGSGSFLLEKAIALGAQVFVSSDFTYHRFFDAEGKIMICDIGHYESEQFTVELLQKILRQKFPIFAFAFSKSITNPVHYYI